MAELKFSSKASFLNANVTFVKHLNEVKLNSKDSLLILGKSTDLKNLQSADLGSTLHDLNIHETWFNESLNHLCATPKEEDGSKKPSNGTSVSWLNRLHIFTISNKCSRTNTPSRAGLVTKVVRQNQFGENQFVLVVCEKKNSVATACAVARAFPLYSAKTSEKKEERNVNVSFLYVDQNGSKSWPNEDDIKCFNALTQSIRLTAKIVEKPCAEMNTDLFLEEVKLVAKELGIEPLVVEGEELNRRGFGGLYNVGKAAVAPPKLVVLSHVNPEATRTIAWVGKGIVYDTGGLCIKTRVGMCTMKQDCGGAAAVLGAFYTAVRLGFKDNLHAILCLAENAVGPNAYRPDDIITLYSGKTVEITNTDAEGRLVLGDGVAFAQKDLKADVILDIATLTGAQGIATGKHHAGLLSNNEQWERACVEAGKTSGDLVFPMVFAPEFHLSEFDSELADMKNSVSKPDNASSSCAGLFVYSHLSSKYEGIWIHVDCASPVSDGDRATGYGVALLNSLFSDSSLNSCMKRFAPSNGLPIKNLEKYEC